MSKFICHRGANYDGYNQNTMRVFKKVVTEGATGIEIDINLSKDGDPMIFHNLRLDGLTNSTGRLDCKTTKELQEVFVQTKGSDPDPIPTFYEYLDYLASLPKGIRPRTQVELKGDNTADVVATSIKKYIEYQKLSYEDFCVISFSTKELEVVQHVDPSIDIVLLGGCIFRSALQQNVPQLDGKYHLFFDYFKEEYTAIKYFNMSPYESLAQEHITDATQRQYLLKTLEDNILGNCYGEQFLETAKQLGAKGISISKHNITKEVVKNAHNNNLLVYCYTLNTQADLDKIKDLEVDGILTDYFNQFHKA
ncbi:MAG: hypothetical protein ISR65_10295 [Bacteriovoracaceae bacterium]|nr:hypothetical protein [Bacteriovoracaceae bacterium]